jgi:hypothetical protein
VSEPTYLGDAVYADFDGYMIRLFTTDGMTVQSEIFFEPQVYAALIHYVQTLKDKDNEQTLG